jgi:hypothetical protein
MKTGDFRDKSKTARKEEFAVLIAISTWCSTHEHAGVVRRPGRGVGCKGVYLEETLGTRAGTVA